MHGSLDHTKGSQTMITTTLLPNGDVLVTFMIDDGRPVSVVGDFNDWDPPAIHSSKSSTVVGMSPCLSPPAR